MIPRVHRRSGSVAEVLRHLFGPGEYGGHHDPRVVAAWAYATTGGVEELQPSVTAGGRRSLRRLIGLLEQPIVAGVNPPDKHVWHCSLHNHADDPLLPDQQWAQVAGEFMAEVGLAPNDDGELLVRLGDPPTPVPEPFAGLLHQLAAIAAGTGTAWLFPGKLSGEPVSYTTIYRRLRALGFPTRDARVSAIRQLVLQAPAPVIADALGFHQKSTARQVANAGATWSRYAPAGRQRTAAGSGVSRAART